MLLVSRENIVLESSLFSLKAQLFSFLKIYFKIRLIFAISANRSYLPSCYVHLSIDLALIKASSGNFRSNIMHVLCSDRRQFRCFQWSFEEQQRPHCQVVYSWGWTHGAGNLALLCRLEVQWAWNIYISWVYGRFWWYNTFTLSCPSWMTCWMFCQPGWPVECSCL
jgi:hypothetical protein